MAAGTISCEPTHGLVSWLLAYMGIPLPLILAVLALWFPSALQLPDACLTAAILFGISPLLVWLAHDWYVNWVVSRNRTTIQRIRDAVLEIEALKIKSQGPRVLFSDEELIDQFPRECKEYVKYVIQQMRE